MKEYQIEVASVTTVYVEAANEDEALEKAYDEAFRTAADRYEAVIIGAVDL